MGNEKETPDHFAAAVVAVTPLIHHGEGVGDDDGGGCTLRRCT
jgi:hypothetical protein